MAGILSKRKACSIGTHDGAFHCDEALGCFLLQRTKQFADADIVRSRDPEKLKDLDIVIDVGGVYEPDGHRYDHHQRGFTEVFGHGFETKLSSAGLVYKHFGKEIVANELKLPIDDPEVSTVYLAVYKHFIEGVDGVDNGVNQFDVGDQKPRYLNGTHLGARVGRLNPKWQEPNTPAIQLQQFLKAVELTGEEFLEQVDYFGKSWLPARQFVKEAVTSRKKIHASGKIMRLPRFCPWKDHLFQLEAELDCKGEVLYCLYEDEKKNWRIQCVSLTAGSFENRKSLPDAWKGLRDADLDKATGETGGIFVHIAGFIGGCKSEAGATAMAIKALDLPST